MTNRTTPPTSCLVAETCTHGIAVPLGDEVFTSKKSAADRVSGILKDSALGEPLQEQDRDVLINLLLRHPRAVEKLAVCVDIVVASEPKYGGRCFWIAGKPARVDFSYRQCLSPATVFGRFSAACRNEVEDDILDFKQRVFRDGTECPVTGRVLKWDDCDVDHTPPRMFAVLVRSFIDVSGVDVASVSYIDQGIGSVFADGDLARRWREYHASKAVLRLLSAEANRHMTAA